MRKLAALALSFSAAVMLGVYVIPVLTWAVPVALVLAAASMLYVKRSGRTNAMPIALITAGACLGFIWTFMHHQMFTAPAETLTSQVIRISARVTAFPAKTDYSESVQVKLTGKDVPNVPAMIYSYDRSLAQLRPGDIISASVKFTSVQAERGQLHYSQLSKGIYQKGYTKGDIEIDGRWAFRFLYFPKYLSNMLKEKVFSIFPDDVSHLMAAFITGDAAAFRKDSVLEDAMVRSGVIHIVSVSGMHLSFLIGFIRQFTANKKKTACICIPMILIFIPMTGASSAVIRSGLMHILILLSQTVRRQSDDVTTLSAVLAMMLIENPNSIANIGLQLSFTSIAGIFLFAPRVQGWFNQVWMTRKKNAPVRKLIISSLSSSIGATVFSAPISAVYFGYVSLIAPLTNILILEAAAVVFNIGFIACIAGLFIHPLGLMLAWLVAWPARYLIAVVKAMSALPFAALYTSNRLIFLWLVFLYGVIIFSYLFKGDKIYRPLIPCCLSVITLCVIMLGTSIVGEYGFSSAAVLDVGQGQSIALTAGGDTVVIDCGGSVMGGAGDTAASYLKGKNRHCIDLLILTHLHSDHAAGVSDLMARIPVKRLAMPLDNEDEDDMLPEILSAAESRGTEIYYVTENLSVEMDRLALKLFAPMGTASANERGIIILAEADGYKLLVTGDVDTNTEQRLIQQNNVPDIDMLVAGHHGSKYSTGTELLDAVSPELAVISVGVNNYGHPTPETLSRLNASGADIYRTDLFGTVEVKIAKQRN